MCDLFVFLSFFISFGSVKELPVHVPGSDMNPGPTLWQAGGLTINQLAVYALSLRNKSLLTVFHSSWSLLLL